MERKTGARGLRSILESALLDTMYELPSMKNVKVVSVDAGVIEDGARPLYVLEEDQKSGTGD
jgi:ATP-dependent Clp protease ATP-binding subunit ClpX